MTSTCSIRQFEGSSADVIYSLYPLLRRSNRIRVESENAVAEEHRTFPAHWTAGAWCRGRGRGFRKFMALAVRACFGKFLQLTLFTNCTALRVRCR